MALTSAKEDSRKAARLPRNQKPAVVHSTYNAPIEACYHPNTVGLHTKEDAVHDAAGVTDRKLALDIATIDRHSKSHLKSRKREEQAIREMCRELRKHVVCDGGVKSTHSERLALPQIGEGSGLNKRKALSANNSPNTERRFREYTRTIRNTGNEQGDMQNVSEDVQRESKGKHGKTLSVSTDNLLFRKQSGTASDHHVHKDPLGYRANSSPTPTITVQHYSDDRTVRKGSRQPHRSVPVWELGLVPARRARTQEELMKASQKLSSGKHSINRHKAADNLTRMPGKGTGASDPRFERLEALLIPCSDHQSTMSKSSSYHSLLDAPEKPNSSPVDIRHVRSAPSSPREKRRQNVSQKSDDKMFLTPRPPSSGHRSALGSPLRRPKIVITKQDNISPRFSNQEKEDNPNESVMLFDLSTSPVRLTPDPVAIVSPPPFQF